MDNKAIFSQAILLIRGGFCQGMIARSLKETYLTAYHSEACFFSLPGAIERSLYEQHQSVGGDFYDFKVHRYEVFKACHAVLKSKNFTLTREIICQDHANFRFPGRTLPTHTPVDVLDDFLDSMFLNDRLELFQTVLLDFNDREYTDASGVIDVLSEAYEAIEGKG